MGLDVYECACCHKTLERRLFHEYSRENVQRAVASRCKKCRKEDRMKKRFPDTVCIQCQGHRKLDSNGICSKCNAESGLRECLVCGKVLPVYFSFVQRLKTCKICGKG